MSLKVVVAIFPRNDIFFGTPCTFREILGHTRYYWVLLRYSWLLLCSFWNWVLVQCPQTAGSLSWTSPAVSLIPAIISSLKRLTNIHHLLTYTNILQYSLPLNFHFEILATIQHLLTSSSSTTRYMLWVLVQCPQTAGSLS